MKKTIVSVLTVLSFVSLNGIASNTNNSSQTAISINEPVLKQGTIVEVTENGGRLVDNTTGEMLDFYHPGAQVSFIVGDSITYLQVTPPKGKPPIVIDIKKPS